MIIKKNRTAAYRFTVDLSSEEDMEFVKDFRRLVKEENAKTGSRFYVKLQGRLGRNNPHAEKFRKGGELSKARNSWQCIPLKYAQHADVYVYYR